MPETHEFSSLQEWKSEIDHLQYGAQIGNLNIDAAIQVVKQCPEQSAHSEAALNHLRAALKHIAAHNAEMKRRANKMKLESFKREHIKDYSA